MSDSLPEFSDGYVGTPRYYLHEAVTFALLGGTFGVTLARDPSLLSGAGWGICMLAAANAYRQYRRVSD